MLGGFKPPLFFGGDLVPPLLAVLNPPKVCSNEHAIETKVAITTIKSGTYRFIPEVGFKLQVLVDVT